MPPVRPRRCERQHRRISLECDGELSLGRRLLLYVHLGRCADCRRFRADISAFTAALRGRPETARRPVVATRSRLLVPAGAVAAFALLLAGLTGSQGGPEPASPPGAEQSFPFTPPLTERQALRLASGA